MGVVNRDTGARSRRQLVGNRSVMKLRLVYVGILHDLPYDRVMAARLSGMRHKGHS